MNEFRRFNENVCGKIYSDFWPHEPSDKAVQFCVFFKVCMGSIGKTTKQSVLYDVTFIYLFVSTYLSVRLLASGLKPEVGISWWRKSWRKGEPSSPGRLNSPWELFDERNPSGGIHGGVIVIWIGEWVLKDCNRRKWRRRSRSDRNFASVGHKSL